MTRFTLTCVATPWASRRLTRATLSILEESICDREILHNLSLVMTEATANVVRHAYKDCPPGKLAVCINLQLYKAIELEISDWGSGIQCHARDVHIVDPESQSGRGLFIMSRLVDEFDIRRDQKKNTVYLLVRVKKNLWRSCD